MSNPTGDALNKNTPAPVKVFTAGEWYVDMPLTGGALIGVRGGFCIASIAGYYAESFFANAHLIAAAPDMREALDEVPLPPIRAKDEYTDYELRVLKWMKEYRSPALRKADGETA